MQDAFAEEEDDDNCDSLEEEGEEGKDDDSNNEPYYCKDENDSITSLKKQDDAWTDFYQYTLEYGAANIQWLARNQQAAFLQLPEETIFTILNKSIMMHRQDPTYDNTPIVEMLMRVRDCRSPFSLLKFERDSIVSQEKELRQEKPQQPLLTWTVNQLSTCFYKQSDTF